MPGGFGQTDYISTFAVNFRLAGTGSKAANKSVQEVYDEWVGKDAEMGVKALEEKFRTAWRRGKKGHTTRFSKNKVLYEKFEEGVAVEELQAMVDENTEVKGARGVEWLICFLRGKRKKKTSGGRKRKKDDVEA